MLNKLLKYDLKGIYKSLVIFYSIGIFFAILTRVFFLVDNSTVINVIAQICSGVTISMIFNIIINNLLRSWPLFKSSLYGDASYLTHTLPVKKSTLYISKVLTALITLFTSVAVITLLLFTAYYSKDNMQILKGILLPLATTFDTNITGILVVTLFVLFLELAVALQGGFTGIILGHRMNSGKTGFSVLFGFLAYMLNQILGIIILFIISAFDSSIKDMFLTNSIPGIDAIKTILLFATIIYTILFIIGFFVNIKLLKKGVNVD